MEIHRRKDRMKSQQFNQQVEAIAGCTLRLLLGTIPNVAELSKHGIRAEAWFRSIKTANEVGLRGHDAVLQIKQYHSLWQRYVRGVALKHGILSRTCSKHFVIQLVPLSVYSTSQVGSTLLRVTIARQLKRKRAGS